MLPAKVFEDLQADVLRDCAAFLPELILCGGIVLLLLLRMFSSFDRLHLGWVSLLLCGGALAATCAQWAGCCLASPEQFVSQSKSNDLFAGMLVYDYFTLSLRFFLLVFALLLVVLTLLTRIPDKEDSADFYTLVLGATVGMMVMSSTNHLLMMFIGIEMASLPSYALAGYLKGRRESSEAALKYVVYGGGAAGIMLYGISLLAGKFGTAYLPQMATAYAGALAAGGGFDPILVLGTLFILIGIAFKLAAVPFHFWCPDVFEGASAEVAGFLSVASKGAALALLARVALALGGMGTLDSGITAPVPRVAAFLVPALALFGILTATFGNLAAFRQTNLKRLLAYSTIAHAGYMMMALATLDRLGVKAVLVYLAAYLLMNLGAFAIVAFLRNEAGTEDLAGYRGLVRRSPWMTIALCVFLLSLLGVPPLVGFVAKVEIFMALWQSAAEYQADSPALAGWLYTAFVVLGINSVISAVYYVKVMKVMIIEERAEDMEGKQARPFAEPALAKAYALVLSLAVLVGIFGWGRIQEASVKGSYADAALGSKPSARADALKGATP
jgi:NADH-quinone oxidoreductase subunit N